jgi:hypothetical protein
VVRHTAEILAGASESHGRREELEGRMRSGGGCRAARSELTYILVSCNLVVDVARRVFVQLLVVSEDDDGDLDRAEHGKLVGLFEQPSFAFEKGAIQDKAGQSNASFIGTHCKDRTSTVDWVPRYCCRIAGGDLHGSVPVVLDRLDLDLPSAHFGWRYN